MNTLTHSLTIKFGRPLTEAEWRVVVETVKAYVPFICGLQADAEFVSAPCEMHIDRRCPGEPEYWH